MEPNKKSKSEVGHIKNLENYADLILYYESLADGYNPVKPTIKLTAMHEKKIDAIKVNEALREARRELAVEINNRQTTFEPIQENSTAMQGSLAGFTEDEKILDDLKTINNAIQGNPSKPQTIEDLEGQEIMRAVSNSQQSFDYLMENYAEAVKLMELIPGYDPNEPHLKVTAFQAYLQELRAANLAVELKSIAYENALDRRDEVFYHPKTGMVQNAKSSKEYIKGVYKVQSPQYQRVFKIKFKTFIRDKNLYPKK